jgi:ribosome production factor 1
MFKSTEKAALQEIGPRFTLKLRWLKKGTPAVQSLGAPPPPLVLDQDGDLGEDEKKDGEASAPKKEEEFEWQWRVSLCSFVFL